MVERMANSIPYSHQGRFVESPGVKKGGVSGTSGEQEG